MTIELTEPEVQELLRRQYCYYCGAVVEISYVGVVFNNNSGVRPRPQVLNPDKTPHKCASKKAGRELERGSTYFNFEPDKNSR
jgi:hypothetical protein